MAIGQKGLGQRTFQVTLKPADELGTLQAAQPQVGFEVLAAVQGDRASAELPEQILEDFEGGFRGRGVRGRGVRG